MNKKGIIIAIVAVIVVAAVVVACIALSSKKTETSSNSIVGSWKNDTTILGYEFVYTFNADGTGNYNAAGTDMPFTYKIDGDKISILYDGDTVSFDTTFSLNGNTLNVLDSNGNDTLYQKVSSSSSKATETKTETKDENTTNSTVEATADTIDMATLSNEEKIEHKVHQLLKANYGDKLSSAKIYVDKMYTKEEVEKDEALKSLNIKDTDIAFEVSLYLEPAKDVDINEFTTVDGVYDAETGWVSDIHRLGILRYNETDKTYSIDNYGTGW